MTAPEVGAGLTLTLFSTCDASGTAQPHGSCTYLGKEQWSGDKMVIDMVKHRQRCFKLDAHQALLSFHTWSNGYLRGEATGPVPTDATVGTAVLRAGNR